MSLKTKKKIHEKYISFNLGKLENALFIIYEDLEVLKGLCSLVRSYAKQVLPVTSPRVQWAEAGLRDDVGQVRVWMLSVSKVEVSPSDVNHLRLLHGQRAHAVGDLRWQLVLHRENVDHHRLDAQGGDQVFRSFTEVKVLIVNF